tara:strand:- start:16745 stop:17686 length:942 start_codon:yes stop_codon:yes gene_type:complete
MEILESKSPFTPIESSVLTIGSYDGIHRGHLNILNSVVSNAHAFDVQSVVITFEPHPRNVLKQGKSKIPLIMGLKEKIKVIESLGIDYIYIINFTKEFSKTSSAEFLNNTVVENFNPIAIITGNNHFFGYKKEGDPKFLKGYCNENKIRFESLPPVLDGNSPISSTDIRELIKKGFLRRANFKLGSIFGFNTTIVKGSGRGQSLEFPTANLKPIEEQQLMPKPGVYFTKGRINGLHLYGMCNFGTRPTFLSDELVMEVHFFHNNVPSDLYGEKVRIEFLERIREEKKFSSPLVLMKQLKKDKEKCLKIQKKYE